MNNRSILVVVSHPDDEVLGCGGTIAKHCAEGHSVAVLFIADGVTSRHRFEILEQHVLDRRRAAETASGILGVSDITFLPHRDNQLDQVPLLVLAQDIEKTVGRLRPEIIYTHHSGDVNIDHRCTHDAVITACRPQPGFSVKRVLFFETLSSTEWRPPSSMRPFAPNWFNDISAFLDQKRRALEAYAEELRPYPHPRSVEAVEYLARWRGASVGLAAAEAFELGREVI
jgi:LmbE family N-acetylglucosaminyl deacetylase